ncbi:MAG TPA: hypothetical protein DEH25_04270 [Chloroflexi bacterium]|nr:hypothetical protein [Chloroflexota bacterium]
MTIISVNSEISTPANGEQITGPGVVVAGNAVGEGVGVGGSGLGVMVADAVGFGVSVGHAVRVGTGVWAAQAESRNVNR